MLKNPVLKTKIGKDGMKYTFNFYAPTERQKKYLDWFRRYYPAYTKKALWEKEEIDQTKAIYLLHNAFKWADKNWIEVPIDL